ncbi:PREDICTED: putative F-box/FBD/LRR-repeat protein At5g56810 [Camelina sativa]|uniref:F-box/FBD/LRR-repeat protein At5g56810 n=1 Tax=Camelina sativa TaxID=90675 RepID=A0ABM1QJ77_CAMSA|nr:PREDICTED: putative F-box/FBD/LRR-repeat protein At5g56810 [Camelina sativa]
MESTVLKIKKVTNSDRISNLSDDLLIKILSLVPVRTAMSTSLLSKQWKPVWKMMPTLVYDETCPTVIGSLGFAQFCSMSLPKASLLRNLNLKLDKKAASKVIDHLLFPNLPPTLLEISITSLSRNFIAFPKNFKVFQTLVVLKLQGTITLDAVVVSPVCFQSLKSLHLISVIFWSKSSLGILLSACPVLEDLFFVTNMNTRIHPFTISVPSLQRLHITDHVDYGDTKFEINAPSLKYLKIIDWSGCIKFVEDMPKLVGAKVILSQSQAEKFIRLLTSVEFLSIIHLHPSMVSYYHIGSTSCQWNFSSASSSETTYFPQTSA